MGKRINRGPAQQAISEKFSFSPWPMKDQVGPHEKLQKGKGHAC